MVLKDFNLSFPVIVKGIEGLTFYKTLGSKVFLCNNKNELIESLKKIKVKIGLNKVFVQEVIERNYDNFVCSFTSFSVKGEIKTIWIGEKVREHPAQFGTATFARSIPVNETYKYSKKLIKELKYTGVCEVEFLRDLKDNTYKLIEINARTWLWVGLAKACGIDYALYIYNHLNNISISYPSEYKKNIGWMNFWTDLFFTLIASLQGKGKIKDFTSTFNKNTKQAVFSYSDQFPFIMMTILLPYLLIKRI
jgi:D-aspartate ligase